MAKMSEGFKNRIRDAKPTVDRIINVSGDEPWQVWIARLQAQAEHDQALAVAPKTTIPRYSMMSVGSRS